MNSIGLIINASSATSAMLQRTDSIVGKNIADLFEGFVMATDTTNLHWQIINEYSVNILAISYNLNIDNKVHYFVFLLPESRLLAEIGFYENPCLKSQMDFLLDVMDRENDVAITDSRGIFLKVSRSYCEQYSVSEDDVIGKSAEEMERKGIFTPSVTMQVLREKKKVTMLQKNKNNKNFLVTGVPILNTNNDIEYVVSFQSIDITGLASLEDKYQELQRIMEYLSQEVKELRLKEMDFPGIISRSKEMQNTFQMILNVAETNVSVILTGETGVGKNIIAKLIHQHSKNSSGPFIEINCGTIPASLIESELFGYERGSFTGANIKGKIGQIALANGGTLFLDEIGELPLNMQGKLLEVIQEKKIRKVGGSKPLLVEFRLVTATNRDLETLVEQGLFRKDLYYRLNVVPINIHPLRERIDDIIPLALHFLSESNELYNKNKTFSQNTLNAFLAYGWPGNVRELKNLVERLVVISDNNLIELKNLPENISLDLIENKKIELSLKKTLELYEKKLICSAYERCKTTVEMAQYLGISQPSVVRKLKKYVPGY